MNPLLNPAILFPLAKSYFFNPGRIKRLNDIQLKKYRDKAFKKMISYAYKVPLYHEKYKQAGIHPRDITGIADIAKLPFITKNDLVENFPDGIIPVGYNKQKAHVICTGGTTGKPVSIYTDFLTMGIAAGTTIRDMKHFGMNLKKSRFVHIGNFNPYRADLIMQENFQDHLKQFFPMKNHLNMDVNQPITEMIERLNQFKPDVIMSYPAVFQHLAYLKKKGQGEHINPKLLWTGGTMLDEYTRSYVEDAFGCRLLNIYPSVEAGSTIAFECMEGNWHIHSDFFHVEAINENNEVVPHGKLGHVVITRLWGRGTPIIRYIGMDDWIRINSKKECSCGLSTPVIEGGVEGRKRANIVLPSGKVFPPGAFCFITPVMHNLKTFKIKQYQIIQKKIDEIEVHIVIDEDLRDVGPSIKKIFSDIKEIYQKKTGPSVSIIVKEVDEIKNTKDARKPPPIVISHVEPEQGYKVIN